MNIDDAWRQLRTAADRTAQRGSLIFHLDLATAAASTALASRQLPVETLATVVDAGGYRVLGFDLAPLPRAIAEVRFDEAGRALVETPGHLPPRAEALARAAHIVRNAAVEGPVVCRAVVVIPANDPHARLEAYSIVTGEMAATAAIVGGHWHFTLTPDGRTVTERRPLAASVGEAAAEDELHSTDDIPSELHTYLSLKHGIAIRVLTRGSGVRWLVDGERTIVDPRCSNR